MFRAFVEIILNAKFDDFDFICCSAVFCNFIHLTHIFQNFRKKYYYDLNMCKHSYLQCDIQSFYHGSVQEFCENVLLHEPFEAGSTSLYRCEICTQVTIVFLLYEGLQNNTIISWEAKPFSLDSQKLLIFDTHVFGLKVSLGFIELLHLTSRCRFSMDVNKILAAGA